MGVNPDAGQIEIIGQYGVVFLYTHEKAKDILKTVHSVLSRRDFWEDEDYLSSMLFRELVKDELNTRTTGFGIGTELYINSNLVVTLDIPRKKICITSILEHQNQGYIDFEEFLQNFSNRARL